MRNRADGNQKNPVERVENNFFGIIRVHDFNELAEGAYNVAQALVRRMKKNGTYPQSTYHDTSGRTYKADTYIDVSSIEEVSCNIFEHKFMDASKNHGVVTIRDAKNLQVLEIGTHYDDIFSVKVKRWDFEKEDFVVVETGEVSPLLNAFLKELETDYFKWHTISPSVWNVYMDYQREFRERAFEIGDKIFAQVYCLGDEEYKISASYFRNNYASNFANVSVYLSADGACQRIAIDVPQKDEDGYFVFDKENIVYEVHTEEDFETIGKEIGDLGLACHVRDVIEDVEHIYGREVPYESEASEHEEPYEYEDE